MSKIQLSVDLISEEQCNYLEAAIEATHPGLSTTSIDLKEAVKLANHDIVLEQAKVLLRNNKE